jgi:hypothetical protein
LGWLFEEGCMKWTRSEVVGLSNAKCCICRGYGLRVLVKSRRELPCNCVLRAIFRACYNRFRDCVANGAQTSTVSLEFCPGKDGRRFYSRKKEEFAADFYLLSRRSLDEADFRVFWQHFMMGDDWRGCCRTLGLDRGNFFHSVYRIEQQLGRVFAETEPYGLYPLDEYFGGVIRRRLPQLPDVPRRSLSPKAPYFGSSLVAAAA